MGRTRLFDAQEVLIAATDSFRDTGYAGTSIDDLLRATGIGKGSLYAAFGGKRALFGRVFDDYCAQVTDAVRRRLAGSSPAAGRRIASLMRGVAKSTAFGEPRPACLLAKATSELAARDSEVATRSRQTFDDLVSAFKVCLNEARDAGDVPSDLDTTEAAHLLVVVLRGVEALSQAGVRPVILRDATELALAAVGLATRRR